MYLHVPTGNVTVLEAGCAAVPRYVHCLDDPANLVVHMIQHYMYSAWLKYMIDCKITKVSRCIALQPSPAHSITCTTTCKNLCYLPLSLEKKGRSCCYAKLLTTQEVFQPTPGLGWTSISGSTWYKENGELQLLAVSCEETCSCEP